MNPFQFNGFELIDGQAGMKIGTDGVLLAAWATPSPTHRCLDIGTGTGLISFLLSRKGCRDITGIDIDPKAIDTAKFNLSKFPEKENIAFLQTDILNFQPSKKFDFIVSNPPFFRSGEKSKTRERDRARRIENLSFETILRFAKSNLKKEGQVNLILPADQEEKLRDLAGILGFSISELVRVSGKTGNPPNRILCKICLGIHLTKAGKLSIRNQDGSYTTEYAQIVKGVYKADFQA